MPDSATLKKMIVKPFKDPGFSQSAGGPYTVTINPEKYSHHYEISYNDEQAPGTAGSSSRFDKTLPDKVDFELIFDSTGAIPGSAADASQEIEKFRKVVYNFNGSVHSPNYLTISWGTMLFNCRLTSMEVSYTLFKPDGTPLRAKVNVSFQGYTDYKTLALQQNKQSPDMTHVVTVVAGDTLPLLCYKIYGSPSYYAEVAKVNNILHFRDIRPGTRLFFPPLTK